jgi:TetR/AcrR family transcriptional regulator, fatty acid metabolism regulator protein
MIGQIVEGAQRDGVFKREISSDFAALMFYGAIEQLLSGWIFDVIPQSEEDFEQAKLLVVEAICGGLERPSSQAATVSG